jgi:hypothetical protein
LLTFLTELRCRLTWRDERGAKSWELSEGYTEAILRADWELGAMRGELGWVAHEIHEIIRKTDGAEGFVVIALEAVMNFSWIWRI